MSDIAGGGIGTPYTLTLYEDELGEVQRALSRRWVEIEQTLVSHAIEPGSAAAEALIEARDLIRTVRDRIELLQLNAIGRP